MHEALAPEELVGCGAGGVIGARREVEDGTAVVGLGRRTSATAARSTFHATVEEVEEGSGALDRDARPRRRRRRDPARRPGDVPHRRRPAASSARRPRRCRCSAGSLRRGRRAARPRCSPATSVVDEGAVGVRLDGVEILPCVSQGAAPIGPELTITAADGHVIARAGGQAGAREAARDDRGAPARGPRAGPGRAADGDRRRRQQARLRPGRLPRARARRRRPRRPARWPSPPTSTPGQVVRLHARDAASADRDLREALGVRMAALGGRTPAGALLFSCNGRGRGHVRPRATTTPRPSPRSSRAPRPQGSSPRARSARSAASTSCTASPPRSPSSPDRAPAHLAWRQRPQRRARRPSLTGCGP